MAKKKYGNPKVAARLRELRLQAGVTQVQLADALGIVQQSVAAVEGGLRPLPAGRSEAWRRALRVGRRVWEAACRA